MRFLEYVVDNLFHVTEETKMRGHPLDPVITNKSELIGGVEAKYSLCCSDCEVVEFRILRARKRSKNKLTTLNFRRGGFGCVKVFSEDSHGVRSWREGKSSKTG